MQHARESLLHNFTKYRIRNAFLQHICTKYTEICCKPLPVRSGCTSVSSSDTVLIFQTIGVFGSRLSNVMETAMQTFDFSHLTDTAIRETLQAIRCSLSCDEARQLQQEILKREPTIAELILFGIEGSEHCSYKSSRSYLKQFITDGEDVIIGAKEDAGIIRVARDASGKGYAIVVSHESHNHPSQVVPYEGAATGVGGNVRDVCCMGAKVVALADDLRFGNLNNPHNIWLLNQVVSGIAGYGNPIGVPNIGGGIQFDEGYDGNCLVTVVTLGAIEEDGIIHSYAPPQADGYKLILVGKPTDSSGFGGASFASFQLEQSKREENKGAVQEPNAFLGRHIIKASTELFALLKERGELQSVAFKDLGAGGIACASVELAESGGYGAVVDIDAVHVSDSAIPDYVILCAETQERYMWVAPDRLVDTVLNHYNVTYALPQVSYGAQARVIGHITHDTRYRVVSKGETIVDAPAVCVTRGFSYQRPLGNLNIRQPEPVLAHQDPLENWLNILADVNIADKSCIYEQYDKQVQGISVLEPGAADSGLICPFEDIDYPKEIRLLGISLSTDQNPRYNKIDPYQGAANAVIESYCNTIAIGATPIALSDCLCYGNPEKPEQMTQFAEGARGIADVCKQLSIPVIAGNVSLYNESERQSIPPSPMVCVIGKISDYRKAIGSSFTAVGSSILMIGERKDELGGSIYYHIHGYLGNKLPKPDVHMLKRFAPLISSWIEDQAVLSCHDISDGGAAVALAEMAITSNIGCDVRIDSDAAIEQILFSESVGFFLEVPENHAHRLIEEAQAASVYCRLVGNTSAEQQIRIQHLSCPIEKARKAWQDGLRSIIS